MRASSLSFITATAAISPGNDRAATGGPVDLDVLGHDPEEHVLYMLERGARGPARLQIMRTRGRLAGRVTPADSAPWAGSRVDDLRARLVRLAPAPRRDFRLRTKVVRRRAVRLWPDELPVRRYDLRVTVRPAVREPVVSMGGRTTVTAFLRPRAGLERVLSDPGGRFSVAVVSYIGIPHGLGAAKQTAILLPAAP